LKRLFFQPQDRRKSAISEIVATLLMIVIAVGIGVTVFGFATNGFDLYGNSFQSLFSNSSYHIAEDVVIEQVAFINTGTPSTSGVTVYILYCGGNPSTISALYVQNVTTSTFVAQFTGSPLPVTISSGIIQSVKILGFLPDHGNVYGFTLATSIENTVLYNA
jgi:uncharacterized protein (UPF0333 family)